MTKTLFFSVGEPSGDQHAARLIESLIGPEAAARPRFDQRFAANPLAGQTHREVASASQPAAQTRLICRGFGGPAMRQAGCRLDLEMTGHAVVGLLEVLPKLRDFFRFADQAEAIFAGGEINAVVLVDFPGFNWHIAKRARRYGIPVYYYCPPQLWAWGAWRVKKMRRLIDHVLAVLPMEQEFFARHGIPTTLVGHPFFDAVADQVLDPNVMDEFEQSRCRGERIVAVLPGSRDHEVHANFPVMLAAIRRLNRELLELEAGPVRFTVAAYRDRHCLWCRQQLLATDDELPIDFFVGKTSEVIQASDCAMMVSGSVSLELMARQKPAAVLYRVGRLLHAVGKRVLRVDSVTLPNLMGSRKVYPEFVSVGSLEPAVDFLVETIRAMLVDSFYQARLKSELRDLTARHGQTGASKAAAAFLRRHVGLGQPSLAKTEPMPGRARAESEQTKSRRAA